MTRPDGGDGDGEGNAERSTKEGFDDVWGALVDSASAEADDGGGTKAWTEEVRAERKREPEEEEVEAPAGPSVTKAWTEEVRAERKHEAPPSPASSSSSALLGPDPEKLRAAADDEMARLMEAKPETVLPKASEVVEEKASEVVEEKASEVVEVRPPARREEKSVRPSEGARERVRPSEEARERARAVEVASEPEVEHAPPRRTALWVAAIAAVLVVGWFAFGSGESPPEEPAVGAKTAKSEVEAKRSSTREGALASAQGRDRPEEVDEPEPPTKGDEPEPPTKVDEPEPPTKVDEPEPPTKVDEPEPPTKADEPPTKDDEDDEPAPANGRVPEMKRDGDPREVPAGTAPANAAAFVKLPIGPGDRAPLGNVGKNGVHVDRIATGETVDKARCSGAGQEFSASRHDVVNVCVRVVHARQKEDLVVLWQKDGGTVRRGKFVVPAVHAYRTRAYLVMRKEYVGKWTVRIQDLEGTELASHPFVVVE